MTTLIVGSLFGAWLTWVAGGAAVLVFWEAPVVLVRLPLILIWAFVVAIPVGVLMPRTGDPPL